MDLKGVSTYIYSSVNKIEFSKGNTNINPMMSALITIHKDLPHNISNAPKMRWISVNLKYLVGD